MHELAIAGHVVEIAARHADGRRVTKVYLKVAHLRQVVPSALSLSFELVAQGTSVEAAELVLEEVPAVGLCRRCGVESRLEAFPLRCGACGGSTWRSRRERTSTSNRWIWRRTRSWPLAAKCADRREARCIAPPSRR